MRYRLTYRISKLLDSHGRKLLDNQNKALDDLFATRYNELSDVTLTDKYELVQSKDDTVEDVIKLSLVKPNGIIIYLYLMPSMLLVRSPKQNFEVNYAFATDKAKRERDKYFYISDIMISRDDYEICFDGVKSEYGEGHIKIFKKRAPFIDGYFEIVEERDENGIETWVNYGKKDTHLNNHIHRITGCSDSGYRIYGKTCLNAICGIINYHKKLGDITREIDVIKQKIAALYNDDFVIDGNRHKSM